LSLPPSVKGEERRAKKQEGRDQTRLLRFVADADEREEVFRRQREGVKRGNVVRPGRILYRKKRRALRVLNLDKSSGTTKF